MPPRLDQIAELTRGIDLPMEPLHPEHVRIIIEVISDAWSYLLQLHPRPLLEEDEANINALMETRLLALVEQNPLWAQMVHAVARGRETLSFDGSHLEKRPDLSLYLTRRNASFPLVVECKIIDAQKDKGGKLYCDNGISRFLSGDYAWAMREAVMIAYVRDSSTIASGLLPQLTRPEYAVETELIFGVAPPDVARSSHRRHFRYPLRDPPRDQPGAIALWHLWLPVVQAKVAAAAAAAATV